MAAQLEASGLAAERKGTIKAGGECSTSGRRSTRCYRPQGSGEARARTPGHPENEACDRMAVAAYKALIEEQKDRHRSGLR